MVGPNAKSATDDLADVERVLAGDLSAFEAIVRRWQGPLINMAWRYCRDRGKAEELAQVVGAHLGDPGLTGANHRF